jgi:hypothetical protein
VRDHLSWPAFLDDALCNPRIEYGEGFCGELRGIDVTIDLMQGDGWGEGQAHRIDKG